MFWKNWICYRSCLAILAIVASTFVVSSGYGQDEKEEKKLPEVEDITLQTKDGVLMRCSWYPGQKEKLSVPIVLLHGWGGDRQQYKVFAEWLQKTYGHAVLIPDLRGHGESLKTRTGMELDREKFGRAELASAYQDLEQCRRFLQDKNNEGELNLEMLTVVAAGETAMIAVDWAIRDWSYPDFDGRKQGRFVKALVLLSPKKSFLGLNMAKLMRAPIISGKGMIPLSMLIAVGGQDAKIAREVSSIHSVLERTRPKVEPEDDTAEAKLAALKKETLFYRTFDVEEQGAELLTSAEGDALALYIAGFIRVKLVEGGVNFEWHELPR